MSEPQVIIGNRGSMAASGDGNADEDVEMDATQATDDALELEAPSGEAQIEADEVIEEASAMETSFIDYLQSPIVELGIGPEDEQITLTAHQALLMKSPFMAKSLSEFAEDVTVRRLEMPSESLDAMGCFLQFLYTGEYYPKKINGTRLELTSEDDGEQLLKHARVYTLAERLEVKELAELALSKVHLISSTARGEIRYARYVYGNTQKTDERIRKPIAGFWGQRSHVLRHEAEDDFKELCIEFPEFAFDVLTHVLDSKERKAERDRDSEVKQSGRKRARQT